MLSVASIFDANNLEAVLPPGGSFDSFISLTLIRLDQILSLSLGWIVTSVSFRIHFFSPFLPRAQSHWRKLSYNNDQYILDIYHIFYKHSFFFMFGSVFCKNPTLLTTGRIRMMKVCVFFFPSREEAGDEEKVWTLTHTHTSTRASFNIHVKFII